MGINAERDIEANLQIGPTTSGMVRLFIEAGATEIPMDFDPEEAEEIAEEIRAAAARARTMASGNAPPPLRDRPTGADRGKGKGNPKGRPGAKGNRS